MGARQQKLPLGSRGAKRPDVLWSQYPPRNIVLRRSSQLDSEQKMSLIVFKDADGHHVALGANSVVKVNRDSDTLSEITYRIGDDVYSVYVAHPVMEVVDAVNKVSGSWL